MRILLVKPHSKTVSSKGHGIHLGLAYLGGVLLKRGLEVKVIDLDLSYENDPQDRYLNELKDFQPQVMGITVNTPDRFNSFEIARLTKKYDGGIPVIAGGPHVSFAAEDTLNNIPEIDFVVRGEGEETFVQLCETIDNNGTFDSIKGIAYRKNGRILLNDNRSLIENLDDIPFPARELFPVEKYDLSVPVADKPSCIHLISSRGCPFKCKFCVARRMAGGRIRMRSPNNILLEILQIKEMYPEKKWLFFYDDNFTVNKNRIRELLEGFKKHKLDFKWGCYCRVDLVDRDLLKLMKVRGCRMISYGIESGSGKVLSLMKKNIDLKQAAGVLQMTKELGIRFKCSMFFNYPGETFIDAMKTIYFAHKTKLSSHEIPWGYMTQIYPGTELCDELMRKNYFPQDFNWSQKFSVPEIDNIPVYKNGLNTIKKNMAMLYKKVLAHI